MKKKKSYSKKELKEFKKVVNKKLKKARKEEEQLRALYKSQKKYITSSDPGMAGTSQYMMAKAMLKKLRNRMDIKIENLESALRRIEKGTYGICKITGNLINKKRLFAKPTARKSIRK